MSQGEKMKRIFAVWLVSIFLVSMFAAGGHGQFLQDSPTTAPDLLTANAREIREKTSMPPNPVPTSVNNWTDMTTGTKPSARDLHAMAYDSESDRVILFGGAGAIDVLSYYNDETWAYNYNTNTWQNMNPGTKPSARYGHAMAYDSESDRVILFGGDTYISLYTDETWAYDWLNYPTAPQNLKASAGDKKVKLTWNAVSNATSYNIYRKEEGGTYNKIGNTTTTSYEDTNVENGKKYYYKVTAVNEYGESNYSNEVSAIPTAPSQPTPGFMALELILGVITLGMLGYFYRMRKITNTVT